MSSVLLAAAGLWLTACAASAPARMERISVSDDGAGFVRQNSGEPFVVWGVNYDRDHRHRLIEDYWADEWPTIVEDFTEIRALGANLVRVHLQFGKFMKSPDEPDAAALGRLAALVRLAGDKGLYLNLTGLGCYHKADVPEWYDALPEAERWAAQGRFWEAVARTCAGSPEVFCYDLMNEPVLDGKQGEGWLADDLAGKHFVQRIAIDLKGRSRRAIARAWIEALVGAIRKHDPETLITVGVIPWAHVWPNARPLFYASDVCEKLDFASVHFYPKRGEVDRALEALKKYDVGKPLVIEETYPLKCSVDELVEFIERSQPPVDGWVSFYWGRTPAEIEQEADSIGKAMQFDWLRRFEAMSEKMGRP